MKQFKQTISICQKVHTAAGTWALLEHLDWELFDTLPRIGQSLIYAFIDAEFDRVL
jgi:hypothetical protein